MADTYSDSNTSNSDESADEGPSNLIVEAKRLESLAKSFMTTFVPYVVPDCVVKSSNFAPQQLLWRSWEGSVSLMMMPSYKGLPLNFQDTWQLQMEQTYKQKKRSYNGGREMKQTCPTGPPC